MKSASLSVIRICVLSALTLSLSSALFAKDADERYRELSDDFERLNTHNLLLQQEVLDKGEALEHLKKFSEQAHSRLAEYADVRAVESHEVRKQLRTKEAIIRSLLREVGEVKNRLGQVISTRDKLDASYLALLKELDESRKSFESSLQEKEQRTLEGQVALQNSQQSEQQALNQVAQLKEALVDTNDFYAEQVTGVLRDMQTELDQTRGELALTTDAYFEVEGQLSQVQEQLEVAQNLLSQGSLYAADEKDLKALQKTLSQLSKATETKSAQTRKELLKAFKELNETKKKLALTRDELSQTEQTSAGKTRQITHDKKSLQKVLSRLKRLKVESKQTIQRSHTLFQQTLGRVQQDLAKSQSHAASLTRKLEHHDLVFKELQTELGLRTAKLKEQNSLIHSIERKLARAEQKAARASSAYERSMQKQTQLRSQLKDTEKLLAHERTNRSEMSLKLQEVSTKLADAELALENTSMREAQYSQLSQDLKNQIHAKNNEIRNLQTKGSQHLAERQKLMAEIDMSKRENNLLATRYSSLQKNMNALQRNGSSQLA